VVPLLLEAIQGPEVEAQWEVPQAVEQLAVPLALEPEEPQLAEPEALEPEELLLEQQAGAEPLVLVALVAAQPLLFPAQLPRLLALIFVAQQLDQPHRLVVLPEELLSRLSLFLLIPSL